MPEPGPTGPLTRPVGPLWARPAPRWVRLVLRVAGAAVPVFFMTLGISGVVHIRHQQSLFRPLPGGIVTTGTVVNSTVSCGDTCTSTLEIQFRDRRGDVHTLTAPSQPSSPAVGLTVQVSYRPTDPSEAHDISGRPPDRSIQLFTAGCLIGVSGLSLVGGAGVGIVARRRRFRPAVASAPTAGAGRPAPVDLAGPHRRGSPGSLP